jgi:hypothetical protein
MARNTNVPTQSHLPIAGIQDDVIIMSDASLRAVLKIDPINFELKSEAEQNAVIFSYQAFLNSLEFPIQIVVQSKKLDLEQYLARIALLQKNTSNELLQLQIEEYVGYLRRLISVANIMAKRFYVIVSYAALSKQAPLAGLIHRQPTGPLLDQDQFERYRTEINNRAGLIGAGLNHIGLKVSRLNTQELIELFYAIYNPDIAAEERLADVQSMQSGLISSSLPTSSPPDTSVSPDPASGNFPSISPSSAFAETKTSPDETEAPSATEAAMQPDFGILSTVEPPDNRPAPPPAVPTPPAAPAEPVPPPSPPTASVPDAASPAPLPPASPQA